MMKVFPLVFLLLSYQKGFNQVIINLQLPSDGISLKSQLWNFSIINTGTSNINVKIDLTFKDVANNQVVFTASSKTFLLTQQVTQLQAANLTPIIYNVVNFAYNVDVNPNGFLPIGTFEVCYAVMKINSDGFEKIAEDCEFVEIQPVSPPLLIEPGDNETIDIIRPFFTWVPPSPVSAFSNLTYNWVLVEVMQSQNPEIAVQQNIPIHSQQGIVVNSLLFPTSLPPLDTSKNYAWQVSANSSNNAISKSEVWIFRIRTYALDSIRHIDQPVYIPLNKINDAAYTTIHGILRYEYLNEINDSMVVFKFYDITNASRTPLPTDSTSVRLTFGQNFIEAKIFEMPPLINKHIYLFELINSKEERWYLKFEFRKPEEN